MLSIEEIQKIINEEIIRQASALKETEPAGLYAPVDYSMQIGGKRLRPLLLLMSYNIFSDNVQKALPAAVAVEVFHNFTLLHDDIMDNAGLRRNKPTVHKKFNANSAILSGDSMAFISYRLLLKNKVERMADILSLFTETAIQVCEGQQYDMEFENRMDVKENDYLLMIRLKTAVLLACSMKAGALLANANDHVSADLYEFGINLGMAFQLQDDLLDSFGDQKTFGKKIGGDIAANKKTYLLIKTLENAEGQSKKELLEWIGKKDFIEEEKIKAVKNIYRNLKINDLTQKKIDHYFEKSLQLLNRLNLSETKKEPLIQLSKSLIKRNN